MLAQIPAWKWEEWKIFDELDPAMDHKIDWGLAHVVQAVIRNGKPLREFTLPFGDSKPQIVPQTVKQQELLIDAWIFVNNEVVKRKGPLTT